jgi:hypothetical protein
MLCTGIYKTAFMYDPKLSITSFATKLRGRLTSRLVTGNDPSLEVILKLDLLLLVIISDKSAIGGFLGRALSELGIGASGCCAGSRGCCAGCGS